MQKEASETQNVFAQRADSLTEPGVKLHISTIRAIRNVACVEFCQEKPLLSKNSIKAKLLFYKAAKDQIIRNGNIYTYVCLATISIM